MKNEGTQVKIKNNEEPKYKKLSISKLFFKMNPLYDPKIRLKIAENIFLNYCIKNNLSQRENNSFSQRKKLQKYDLKKIKYAYDFSIGQLSKSSIQSNNNSSITNILNKNKNKILITSLKNNKFLRMNDSSSKHKKYYYKKNNLIKKGIQTKSYVNKLKSNLNKIKDNENKAIKKNLSLNCLEKNFSYEGESNCNIYNISNNNNYISKCHYNFDFHNNSKSNAFLPKITKKYVIPFFENNKSKEIKDIFSLKQYQMKEIEESLKLKPFVY